MAIISEYHQYLFLGKITDSLTPDEAAELEEFFKQHPEALNEYKELLTTLPPDKVETSYSFLNRDGYWKPITGEHKKRGITRRILFRRLSIAAITVGIILVGVFVFNNRDIKPSNTDSSVKKEDFIKLRLANGKVINLSKTKGQIEEAGLMLNNSKESLSYRSTENKTNGINSVTVPTGMDYKIILSDGSLVWMNSTTQLQFPSHFSEGKREITITGEAYLEVAKDSKKTFIVHLPNTTVKVLGTSFNVNSYDSGIVRVALVEGRVNFSSAKASADLKPGIEGVYNNNFQTISQDLFQANNTLSWQKGLYFFEEATLHDLSKVLFRWFGVTTVIDNAELKSKKFAGILDKNKSIDIFLRNLKIISGINSYFDKDGVLHFK